MTAIFRRQPPPPRWTRGDTVAVVAGATVGLAVVAAVCAGVGWRVRRPA